MDVKILDEGIIPPSPKKRRKWMPLLVAVCVMVTIVAIVGMSRERTSQPPASPVSGTVQAGETTVLSWGEAGEAWRTGMGVDVLGQVAPGLDQCDVSVSYTAASRVKADMGIEWPHTVAGAVGMAANVARWRWTPYFLNDALRAEWQPLLMTPGAFVNDDAVHVMQEQWGLTWEAAPVEEGLVPYLTAYPQYGAFKIGYVNRGWAETPGTGEIEEVLVSYFLPVVNGVDTRESVDHVATWFVVHTMVVTWTDAGWRVSGSWRDNSVPGSDHSWDAPHARTNMGYEAMAELLGGGWCVPKDGTQAASTVIIHSGE